MAHRVGEHHQLGAVGDRGAGQEPVHGQQRAGQQEQGAARPGQAVAARREERHRRERHRVGGDDRQQGAGAVRARHEQADHHAPVGDRQGDAHRVPGAGPPRHQRRGVEDQRAQEPGHRDLLRDGRQQLPQRITRPGADQTAHQQRDGAGAVRGGRQQHGHEQRCEQRLREAAQQVDVGRDGTDVHEHRQGIRHPQREVDGADRRHCSSVRTGARPGQAERRSARARLDNTRPRFGHDGARRGPHICWGAFTPSASSPSTSTRSVSSASASRPARTCSSASLRIGEAS